MMPSPRNARCGLVMGPTFVHGTREYTEENQHPVHSWCDSDRAFRGKCRLRPKVAASLDHGEFLQGLFVNREAEAGHVFVEIDVTILCDRLTFEHIPEQFVAHLDFDWGKIF